MITSKSFSTSTAKLLNEEEDRESGYDSVEYKLTRFSKVPRLLSIPHPKAYADLALCLESHWDKISYIDQGENSVLRIREHADGRILITNYDQGSGADKWAVDKSLGKHYRVRTDISNFYPSIYSHVIPWALIGIDNAKKDKKSDEWYNQIDKYARQTKRNETNGVAIGPATSYILAEIILTRIDAALSEEFTFTRFSDDYTAYCDTREQATEFILHLAEELAKYNLILSPLKTSIDSLPQPISPAWITELRTALPDNLSSPKDVYQYLSFAVDLSPKFPDGSVMKYALKQIIGCADEDLNVDILRYGLNIAVHHPIVLPVLLKLINRVPRSDFSYHDVLFTIMKEHIRFRRSDAVSWLLYYCRIHRLPIPIDIARSIISSGECIPMLLLTSMVNSEDYLEDILSFTTKIDQNDLYGLDQYWMLLYQLFLDGRIDSPYPRHDRTFEILRSEGVTFVDVAAAHR